MGLPESYQVSLIHPELVQATPDLTMPSTSRHLLKSSTPPQHMHEEPASTDPAGQLLQKPEDEQLFMRLLLQQQQAASTSRELLADSPVTLSTVVWAISLLSSPDIPDAAALAARTSAEDAANDLVLQLVVTGYVGESQHACMVLVHQGQSLCKHCPQLAAGMQRAARRLCSTEQGHSCACPASDMPC